MAIFVYDSFTGTSGTGLASHTGETGATWTRHASTGSGAMTISNANRVYGATTSESVFYASGNPISADYVVRGIFYQVDSSTTDVMICGRIQTGAETFYGMRLLSGQVQLYKCVASSFTSLGTPQSYSPTTGIPVTLELVMVGSTISAYVNGNNFITVTDTSITAAGKVGFRSVENATNTTGMHVDSITGYYNAYWVNGNGTWSQPTYSNDTFTGTSGTNLTAHTSDSGGTWSKITGGATGNFQLDGSGGVFNATAGEVVTVLNQQPPTADYTLSLDINYLSASATTEIGLVARGSTSAENHYLLQSSNNNINMFKCVNGTYTQLGSNFGFTPTLSTPFNLQFIVSGTSLKAVLNGTVVISVTDSTYTAAGYVGIRASEASGTSTGAHGDNFKCMSQNWATGSGGVAVAGYVPAAGDNVIFDFNSGTSPNIKISSNVNINSWIIDPYIYGGSASPFTLDFGAGNITVTLNGTNDASVQGSNSFQSNVFLMNRAVTTLGSQNFNVVINGYGTWENLSTKATFGSITVNSPGQTISQSAGQNAPAGGFYDGFYTINSLTLTAGTLQLAGLPFGKDSSIPPQTWEYFQSNNTNTRTLDWNAATAAFTKYVNITNLWNVGGTGFTMLNTQYATINFTNEQRMFDSLTDTSGRDLSVHIGEINASWAELSAYSSGSFVFTDSARIRSNSTNTTLYYVSSNPPSFVDGTMQADIYVASLDGSKVGILGRFNAATESGYTVHYDSTNLRWELFSILNATYTSIGTFSQTLVVGKTYTVQLQFSGSTISVIVNDTPIISVTDTTVTGAGTVGVKGSNFGTTPTNTKGLHISELVATPNNSVVQLVSSPGTAASDASFGIIAWTNPNNAKVQDNSFATVSF